MAFEDLVQSYISVPEDQAALKALADKHPALRDTMLRQEDYSRKMDAVKADLEELNGEKGWRNWRKTNWDEQAGATRKEVELKNQLADTNRQLEELKLTGGDNVNFDEVMAELDKRIPTALKTHLDTEIATRKLVGQDDYLKDVNARLGSMGVAFEGAFAEGVPVALRHMKQFDGEVIDMRALLKFMGDNKLSSLEAAYEKMYEPRLKEFREKQQAAHEEKIRAEEREKVKTEMAQSPNGKGNMVDHEGAPAVMGPLQRRRMEAAQAGDKIDPAKAPLGSGTIASIAAQEYEKKDRAAHAAS